MQIVRTVVWVLLLVALLLFSYANWDPMVTVRIWDGIVVDTKIPAIVIIAFLVGFVPMWLLHRAHKWTTARRIASLENAARTVVATPVAVAPNPEPAPAPEPETPLQPDPAPTDTPKTDESGKEPGAQS